MTRSTLEDTLLIMFQSIASNKTFKKYSWCGWKVVVVQLSEQSLPIPEVCSSNPVIGEFLHRTIIYYQL